MRYFFLYALMLPLGLGAGLHADDTSEYPRAIISTSLGDITVELYPDSAPKTVEIFLGLAEGERDWRDPESQLMVSRPYYDDTTFHRVIPGFMIQGGDVLGTGQGGAGFTFADEINAAGLGLDKQPVIANGRPHPSIAGLPDVGQGVVEHFVRPRLGKRGITQESPQQQQQQAFGEIIAELEGELMLQELYEAMGYRYDEQLVARDPVAGSLCLANRGPNTNSGQFFINVGDTPHLRGRHTVFGHVVAGMEVVQAIAQVEANEQARPLEPVVITSIRPLPVSADQNQEQEE